MGRGAAPFLAALLCLPLAAHAQDTAPTAAELLPGAPEGAETTGSILRDWDRYPVPVAPFGGEAEPLREVHGEVAWSAVVLDAADATVPAILSRYRDALTGAGQTALLDCMAEVCGGFDFRFGIALLPAPVMLMDATDFGQLTVRAEAPESYVSVLVSRVLGRIHIQSVAVLPRPAPEEGTLVRPEDAGAGELVLAQDEAVLLDTLRTDGHVAVEGLFFETGGAAITDESAPALARLAAILGRDADLELIIVGHSDNVGGLEPNMDLSRRRAEAVLSALVERGVDESQLSAAGVAFLAPLTSNATAQGRNLNRRVELVLR